MCVSEMKYGIHHEISYLCIQVIVRDDPYQLRKMIGIPFPVRKGGSKV